MHNFVIFLVKLALLILGAGWMDIVGTSFLANVPATQAGVAYTVIILTPGFAAVIASALVRFK